MEKINNNEIFLQALSESFLRTTSKSDFNKLLESVPARLRESLNMKQYKDMKESLSNLDAELGKTINAAEEKGGMSEFIDSAKHLRENVQNLYKEINTKSFENVIHRINGEEQVVEDPKEKQDSSEGRE